MPKRGFPAAMGALIEELERLPGIGARTAERLASHLLLVDREEAMRLAYAIRDLKRDLRRCTTCCNFDEESPCSLCRDPERDERSLCVVEESRDVAALEEAEVHGGRYHVLGGRLAPLEGRPAGELTLTELRQRVQGLLTASPAPVEIILATDPDLEGEATALLVAQTLAGVPGSERCAFSRIATGMPTGSAIEYAHREVLADAYLGRHGFAPGATPPARRGRVRAPSPPAAASAAPANSASGAGSAAAPDSIDVDPARMKG